MKRNILFLLILSILLIITVGSCKKTYFYMTEEIHENQTNKFTVKDSYYRMGKSIALTGGRYEITPGDSIVLFIVGQGKVSGVGSEGVMGLDFAETARFFISLPVRLSVQEYDTQHGAICEITGSLNYGQGESIFTCQSGSVVIDSLKKDNVYGHFDGTYLNTSNKSFTVEGPFKAGLKQ
jgi:hypothetical protein